jgi:hypothetical protein
MQKAISIHVKIFHGEKDKSEHIMIPDRRFSSKKISVEGVLWSSRRRQRENKEKNHETHLNEL